MPCCDFVAGSGRFHSINKQDSVYSPKVPNIKRTLFAGFFLVASLYASALESSGAEPEKTLGILLAVDHGKYLSFDSTGSQIQTIDSGTNSESTGTCAFGNGQMYALGWDSRSIVEMSAEVSPRVLRSVVGPWWLPESMVVASNGDIWLATGEPDHALYKVNPDDLKPIENLDPQLDGRGVWLALSSDQHTMFYTAEGHTVKRFDIVTKTQLPDFATLPDSTRAYQMAILAPGDGSNGVVVAAKDFVYQLDAQGQIVNRFTIENDPNWIGVLVDPTGSSVWGVDQQRNRLVRWSLANGQVEVGPISIPAERPASLCTAPESNIKPIRTTVPLPPPSTTVPAKPIAAPNGVKPPTTKAKKSKPTRKPKKTAKPTTKPTTKPIKAVT
jgi:hypothetical protein